MHVNYMTNLKKKPKWTEAISTKKCSNLLLSNGLKDPSQPS